MSGEGEEVGAGAGTNAGTGTVRATTSAPPAVTSSGPTAGSALPQRSPSSMVRRTFVAEGATTGPSITRRTSRRGSGGGDGTDGDIIRKSSSVRKGAIKPASSFVIERHESMRSQPGFGDGQMGTVAGVVVPTVQNMWGVLIFLRFFYIVGNAGVLRAWAIVAIAASCAYLTALSISAIATNGRPQGGGAYRIISRSLGAAIGGAVGLIYWLGVSLAAVMESLGAVEVLLTIFPDMAGPGISQAVGSALIAALTLLVLVGIKAVSRVSAVLALVVVYSIASLLAGLLAAPVAATSDVYLATNGTAVTGLSSATLEGNWGSSYLPGEDFTSMLAVFFPCFTGILSGANRGEALADPHTSIPRGTITAITISLTLFAAMMGLWGAVAPSAYLNGSMCATPEHGGAEACPVISDIGWPWVSVLQWGIIISSMSQTLQNLVVAPRVLQALAADGVIPVLRVFAKKSGGEPRRALGATYVVAASAVLMGQLELVAPILSMCFLSMYLTLNAACFVLAIMGAPSWRPRWPYFHWLTSLLGALVCLTLMFLIQWYWALIILGLVSLLYAYIDFKAGKAEWGSGLSGVKLQQAWRALLAVTKSDAADFQVNWRPQLLAMYDYIPEAPVDGSEEERAVTAAPAGGAPQRLRPRRGKPAGHRRSSEGEGAGASASETKAGAGPHATVRGDATSEADSEVRPGGTVEDVTSFVRQLRKSNGMTLLATVMVGAYTADAAAEARDEQRRVRGIMDGHHVAGFAKAVVADSLVAGRQGLVQAAGLGALSPNTVLLPWPRLVPAAEAVGEASWAHHPDEASDFVETLESCTVANKAVLVAKGLRRFPRRLPQQGFIDLWWIVHDGDLLLLVAHLLRRHRVWRDCRLRIHMVAEPGADHAHLRAVLEDLVHEVRIQAEVSVVEADDVSLAPYAAGWTIKAEERQKLLQELSLALHGAGTGNRRPRLGSGGTVGSAAGSGGAQSSGGAGGSTGGAESKADSPRGTPVLTALPSSLAEARPSTPRRGPVALSRLRGTTAGSSSPLAHASTALASLFGGVGAARSRTRSVGTDAGSSAASPRQDVGSAPGQHGGPGAGSLAVPGQSVRSEEVVVAVADAAVAAAGASAGDSGDTDASVPPPLTLGPSAAPAAAPSGAASATTAVVGKRPTHPSRLRTVTTQWDSLNATIRARCRGKRGARTQLVILNLPDPAEGQADWEYMRYIDALTAGLPRVLLVHGSGNEFVTAIG